MEVFKDPGGGGRDDGKKGPSFFDEAKGQRGDFLSLYFSGLREEGLLYSPLIMEHYSPDNRETDINIVLLK